LPNVFFFNWLRRRLRQYSFQKAQGCSVESFIFLMNFIPFHPYGTDIPVISLDDGHFR
jgi:hypothetical protein